MGASLSAGDKVRPRELNDIRKFYGRTDSDVSDDFKTKNRSTTDVCFLLFITLFLIVLLCFVGYCIFNGDIFRIINGYDSCGNVCGRNNIMKHGDKRTDECKDSSTNNEPFHIILRRNDTKAIYTKCVSNCNVYDGYRKFFNRCVPVNSEKFFNFFTKAGIRDFFEEICADFQLCWHEFIYLCLISLAFSGLIMILFRYLVGMVVWIVLLGTVLVCCLATTLLWITWNQSRKPSKQQSENRFLDADPNKTKTYLVLAILASIITIAVILIIIVMRKRIKLVVQLFKEAGKAIAAIPHLLFQPLMTFLSLVLIIVVWFYFSLWIESSGYLTHNETSNHYYKKDFWMKFTRWYNILAMLWMCQFVIGCQHMVISGAVSTWYFSRNKETLGSPLLSSCYNLVRYHLGSVALGSFLIAIVQFARVLLKAFEKYLNSHRGKCVDYILKCCQCCLYCFENILKYLSRNAYIEIALYGYPFCQGARRAFKQLVNNVLRVTAINSVGDFVLFLGKVLVVIATVLIGVKMLQNKEGVQHIWVPVTLAGLFGYFVAHCFMTVYEMAIDTIFLCFCEDCEQNDGISKPYYMSRGLMVFVENSKKAMEIDDYKNRQSQAWQPGVPTISASMNKVD